MRTTAAKTAPALARAYSAQNVGILGAYTYFPRTFVAQEDLEQHDGVSAGKYTKGLGQEQMAFCGPFEDINSICKTAVANLLAAYDVDPKSVGRMEVGTETSVDKSKSVKSHLMDLFAPSGNHSIEGIDTTNACYGGTNALFNTLNWMGSPYWDGRNAIVVAADIAVYEKGPARPTGGVGAVAMLIGPNAPAVFGTQRATYMENAWDFFKPHMHSEYPEVDGHHSNACYLRALDACYQEFAARSDPAARLDALDHMVFHSPYSALVKKSYARLHFLDARMSGAGVEAYAPFVDQPLDATYADRDFFKAAVAESAPAFAQRVAPSLGLGLALGNSYCGSMYCGIQSLIDAEGAALAGKRAGLFSYGSGLAASLFDMTFVEDPTRISAPADVSGRLAQRVRVSAADYEHAMGVREARHSEIPMAVSSGDIDEGAFFPGTFVLDEVDTMGRRAYRQV